MPDAEILRRNITALSNQLIFLFFFVKLDFDLNSLTAGKLVSLNSEGERK